MARKHHLRVTRKGLHNAAPAGSRSLARDLCWLGDGAGDRLLDTVRYNGRGTDAGALFHRHRHLVDRGLRNYWGYNSIAFFAPELRYAASDPVQEFKTMVKTFHSVGIEVILDVVYNHTAE